MNLENKELLQNTSAMYCNLVSFLLLHFFLRLFLSFSVVHFHLVGECWVRFFCWHLIEKIDFWAFAVAAFYKDDAGDNLDKGNFFSDLLYVFPILLSFILFFFFFFLSRWFRVFRYRFSGSSDDIRNFSFVGKWFELSQFFMPPNFFLRPVLPCKEFCLVP